jgi:hypothetical protein
VAKTVTRDGKTLQQITPDQIEHIYKAKIEPALLNPTYSLVNLQDYTRQIVGTITGDKVSVAGPILFPGNVNSSPSDSKVQVGFSIAGPYE